MKRNEVKFYLKKYKDATGLIVAHFNFKNCQDGKYSPFKYSTNIRIPVAAWDFSAQKILTTYKGLYDINGKNDRLEEIAEKITHTHRKLSNLGLEITISKLRNELSYADSERPEPKISFLGFIKDYISTCSKKRQTVKNYGSTLTMLQKFSDSNKYFLSFESIDLIFYEKFTIWCRDQDRMTNTIGTYIKNIKFFMTEAKEKGLHNNLVYTSKKFKGLSETASAIYLNENELEFLLDLDLSYSTHLHHTRSMFLIACCTGLRHSDWKNLAAKKLESDGSVKIITKKTAAPVYIPSHWMIQEILNRNGQVFPTVYGAQYSNRNLIEIGKIAYSKAVEGIDNEEINSQLIDPNKFFEIRTHTGRRSFATNAFLSGIPVQFIMKWTAHKTERNFYKYIKMSPDDLKSKTENYPFFTGKSLNPSESNNKKENSNSKK